MKTMKKVLILCLLIVLSISTLAACGEKGGQSGDIEFTITYDLNTDDPNAKFVANEYVQQVNKYHNAQNLREPAKPKRLGYDFMGWYRDKECTDLVMYNWSPKFDKDTTLYAKWAEQNSFTFEFYCKDNLNGEEYPVKMDIDGKRFYINDIIDYKIIEKGYREFELENKKLLEGRGLGKGFTNYKDADDPLVITISRDTVVEENFKKYAEVGPDEKKHVIKLYVQIYEKQKQVRFLNDNFNLCFVPCAIKDLTDASGNVIKEGTLLFDQAYKVDEFGNKINFNNFVMADVNGDGKLEKSIPDVSNLLEEYQIFDRWQVTTTNKEKMQYYDIKGRLIDTKGNFLDEQGNHTDEAHAVYLVNHVRYDEIVSIYVKTKSKSYTVKYKVTLPEFGVDGNPIVDNGKERFQIVYLLADGTYILEDDLTPDKEKELYTKSLQYNSSLSMPDNLVRPLLRGFYSIKWAFANEYPKMGVSKGEIVDINRHQIKQDIELITVLERKIDEVAFVRNANEYFNTPDESKSTTMTFPLKELNDILLNPEPGKGADFKTQVGNMYYVLPNTHTPTQTHEFTQTEIDLIAQREKSLLMQHYILRGFCLAEDKGLGDDAIPDKLVIIVTDEVDNSGKVTRKFTLKDNKPLTLPEGKKTLVLKPIFEKRSNVEVKIDLSKLPQGATGQDKVPSVLKSTLGTNNGTQIFKYNSAIKAPGYKFTRWEVISTPFDEDLVQRDSIGIEINRFSVKKYYNGVTFNEDYPVLGPTTIRPVLERDVYSLNFVDSFGTNVLDEKNQITADIDNKKVTKAQIDLALSKLPTLKINKPANEVKFYEFDNWYAVVDNKTVTLAEYLSQKNITDMEKEYSFHMNQDVTFEARYKFIEYKVIFKEFSKYDTKDTIEYVDSDVTVLFNKNGVLQSDYDKLNKYFESYKPTDFNYTTKAGEQKNFVIGWYFEVMENGVTKQVQLSTKTPVAEGLAPVDLATKTLIVKPILQEYNVTINAGLGDYLNKDINGVVDSLNPTKKKVSGIKGGFFGFELPDAEKEVLKDAEGYKQNTDTLFYYMIWDDVNTIGQNIKVFVKDNHVREVKEGQNVPLRVTDDTEFTYCWTPIDHDVTVKFYDLNEKEIPEKELKLKGNVVRIFNPANGEDCTLQQIIDKAIEGNTPAESFYTYIYEIKDNKEDVILDHTYQNPYNNFTTATRNRTIYVKLRYNNLHLTMNANGGYYIGENINGQVILETYIDKDSALTMNAQGELTHKADAFSAYVTKNQENLPGKKNDQKAPVRNGYVFAGFSTVENAKIGVHKFYYGYKDASDIKNFKKIFGDNLEKTIWLGDTTQVTLDNGETSTKFIEFAKGDLINITTEGSVITSIKVKSLYAQWIPIKTQVNYFRPDGKTPIDLNEFFPQYGGKVEGFKEILEPDEYILNPYNYAASVKNKLDELEVKENGHKTVLINFVTEKNGIAVENKNKDGIFVSNTKASQFSTFDPESPIHGNVSSGFYYLAECKVIESTKTGIGFIYDISYEGLPHQEGNYLPEDAKVTNKLAGEKITIRAKADGNYFAYRSTFTIDGRFVDNTKGNPLDAIQFVKGKMGELKLYKNEYHYLYKLEAKKAQEEIPIVVDVHYENENRNTITKRTNFNDKMINPYYDAKSMQTVVVDELTKQETIIPNYYKAIMVKPVLVGDDIQIKRAVWKTVGRDVVMEEDPYDLTKNKPIGINSDLMGAISGGLTKPTIEKNNNVNSIVLETTVYADWIVDVKLTKNVKLNVNYFYIPENSTDKDANGNPIYSQLYNDGKPYYQNLNIGADKHIVNVTVKEQDDQIIEENKNQITKNILYRTWKVDNTTLIDKLEIKNGKREIVADFDVLNYFAHGVKLQGIVSDGVYYITINTYESYEVYNTVTVNK